MRSIPDRNTLIRMVEGLRSKGSFAVKIGELALIADDRNLEILINAFPQYFIEGQAYIRLVYDGRYNHLLEGQA